MTWEIVEESLKNAVLSWWSKVYKRFKAMFQPLIEAYVRGEDGPMAQELQYYLNCSTCSKAIEVIRESPNDKLLIDMIIRATIGVCYEALTKEQCQGLALQGHQLLTNAFFDVFITQDFFCSYLMPLCGQGLAYEDLTIEDYMEAVLADKPKEAADDDFLDKLYETISLETDQGWQEPDTYKVLQITDWHIDLNYTEGARKTDCGDVICCGERHGVPERSDLAAGRYGELTNCDMPLETAEKQLNWLRDNLIDSNRPDLILWTGDSISHQMLHISEEEVYKTIRTLTAMLQRLLPDIPVVVSIGNHDFEPANY